MTELQINGVLSKTGCGKSRYLMAKATEEVVSSTDKEVLYLTDEHLPCNILGHVEQQSEGANHKNNFSVQLVDNEETLESARKSIFGLSANKPLHVFMDIHNKYYLTELLSFVQLLPQADRIKLTISQQLDASSDATAPIEKELIFNEGNLVTV